jgi:ATP dependent DNA ligase domain
MPTKAERPPSGELWLHEIKHDGFRVIARKGGDRVIKLYSRPGNDLTKRFPLIVEALARSARAPASSTERRSPATTTASHPSIASATAATMPPCSPMPST